MLIIPILDVAGVVVILILRRLLVRPQDWGEP